MGGIEQAVEGRSPWGTHQSPDLAGTEEPAVGSRAGGGGRGVVLREQRGGHEWRAVGRVAWRALSSLREMEL